MIRFVKLGLAWGLAMSGLTGAALSACETPSSQVGTNTNWMRLCDSNAECGTELSCECGRCTLPCGDSVDADSTDSELSSCDSGSVCSPTAAAALQCGGLATLTCQPTCNTRDDCEPGRLCHHGVCTDALAPLTCPEDAWFCDDFETEISDESTWVVTDGNSLAFGADDPFSGDRALEVGVTDGPSVAYLRAPLPPRTSGELYVSGWVRVPEETAHNVAPLALWSGAEEGWALRTVITDANLEVWTETTPLTSSVPLQAGQWHCIQMHVTIGPAPDGSVTLSVDGTPVSTAVEIDTLPEGGIEAVALGTLWAASAAHLGVDRVIVGPQAIDCFQ